MKFICSRDQLMDAISIVQKAVAPRSTMSILEGILVEADKDVKLTGYDLETGIEYHMDADVPEKGSIILNSRMFGEIIRKMPDDILTIETKANQSVLIECSSTHFSIRGIVADEYPKIPDVDDGNNISLPQQLLKDMIKQTIFAVSTDESRPILNGCYLVSEGKSLEMVAIDGFRLALRHVDREEDFPQMKFIIPGKALGEIGRVLESSDKPVEIHLTKNHIRFDTGNIRIVSRLIQGEYMNYRGILPQTAETTIRIGTRAMMEAVERASLVISTEDRRYPVRLSMTDDETLVVNANTELGTLREEIGITSSGSKIDIDYNPRYFIDALKAIEDDEIEIIFNGSMGPSVIRPLEGSKFAYLVLPLRR